MVILAVSDMQAYAKPLYMTVELSSTNLSKQRQITESTTMRSATTNIQVYGNS